MPFDDVAIDDCRVARLQSIRHTARLLDGGHVIAVADRPPLRPACCICWTQPLQQPQLGSFQTTSGGNAAARAPVAKSQRPAKGAAAAASTRPRTLRLVAGVVVLDRPLARIAIMWSAISSSATFFCSSVSAA